MVNRLAAETSPYLQQHADNPVHWFPWGDDAFAEAEDRDVPIFLSVGYSSCHWCHVMADESFDDDEVAALLNERFVNIKVDREERPDVDAVYMRALQAMTGQGGWPMSVFLTPDGRPYYAGTYWPRHPQQGMASFPQVAEAVADAWADRRGEVEESAESITAALAKHRDAQAASALDLKVTEEAAEVLLARAWDREHGGFGRAPKFPQAMTIEWLLLRHVRTGHVEARDAAVHALHAMARGGIHDQLAGGFARYSTDARWLVPHFEKMLYDNALLLSAYATGASVTGDRELARIARVTANYLLTELITEEGAFVAATDADSEGVEGRYFVWSHDELTEILGGLDVPVDRWLRFFGATPHGNFEGSNVLYEPIPRQQFAEQEGLDRASFDAEFEQVRAALLARRADRVPPGVDNKVLTDWNALAIRGLVRAGLLLGEDDWISAAERTATFLHERHVVDGELHHTSVEGEAAVGAFLEDFALLAMADLELFQATGDARWFERALALAETAHERFHDAEEGGWFQTAHDGEELFLREKQTWDNATPAGTSVMIDVCLRLAGLTGDLAWRARAEQGILLLQEGARKIVSGYGWFLQQVEALAAEPREVAIIGRPGPARDDLAMIARRPPRPGTITVVADVDHGDQVPLLVGRDEVDGRPAAYVCRNMVCDRPVTDVDALAELLESSRQRAL